VAELEFALAEFAFAFLNGNLAFAGGGVTIGDEDLKDAAEFGGFFGTFGDESEFEGAFLEEVDGGVCEVG
jgi:hypothetical protein